MTESALAFSRLLCIALLNTLFFLITNMRTHHRFTATTVEWNLIRSKMDLSVLASIIRLGTYFKRSAAHEVYCSRKVLLLTPSFVGDYVEIALRNKYITGENGLLCAVVSFHILMRPLSLLQYFLVHRVGCTVSTTLFGCVVAYTHMYVCRWKENRKVNKMSVDAFVCEHGMGELKEPLVLLSRSLYLWGLIWGRKSIKLSSSR